VASFQNKRAQAKALQEMKSPAAELQARVTQDVASGISDRLK